MTSHHALQLINAKYDLIVTFKMRKPKIWRKVGHMEKNLSRTRSLYMDTSQPKLSSNIMKLGLSSSPQVPTIQPLKLGKVSRTKFYFYRYHNRSYSLTKFQLILSQNKNLPPKVPIFPWQPTGQNQTHKSCNCSIGSLLSFFCTLSFLP